MKCWCLKSKGQKDTFLKIQRFLDFFKVILYIFCNTRLNFHEAVTVTIFLAVLSEHAWYVGDAI